MAYTDIDDPSAYFQTALYNGTGGSHSITNTGNSDLQPDWVWVKSRSFVADHELFDSVRGAGKALISNGNYAESSGRGVNSFDSDGFSIVNAQAATNTSGQTYTAWQWKKTADAGFDIVSYSGNNGTNRQISHSLSAKPDMMIVKCRQAGLWKIYHSSLGATKYLVLEDTAAAVDNNSTWNDTEPTSSNFTLGDDGNVNETGETYINYLFAEKKGYSKFGSYLGTNAGANGQFIYTGFKPAFVLIKDSSASNAWTIRDTKRNTFNPATNFLMPNANDAEVTAGEAVDILSNGFKIKANGGKVQDSGNTYIFMAFASEPFTTSSGVPATAR